MMKSHVLRHPDAYGPWVVKLCCVQLVRIITKILSNAAAAARDLN
jgi:hypothetical protein